MKRKLKLASLAACLGAAHLLATVPAAAEEAGRTVILEETVISGNQELPKVLYVLPWQEANSKSVKETVIPEPALELLEPILPPAHRRQMVYRHVLEKQRLKHLESASEETDAGQPLEEK